MGYLGTKPANQIIDSALIADGTVTTSDLASGLTVNFADGSASTPSITNDGDTNTGIFFPAADTIAFAEGGTEVMRLDSTGDVNLYSGKSFKSYNPANTRFGSFLTSADGTVVSAFNGSGEPLLLTSPTGYMNFSTNGSERMRIDSSGNVTFYGGTANLVLNSTATSRYWQQNASNSEGAGFTYHIFQRGGSGIGTITFNGSGVSYNTTSDYRLKDNVAPMTDALSKVALLKPCTYTWKADGSDGQGFIAHELQSVVPECVTGEKDAVDEDGNPKYQGIDTSFLVATLTAAIQEQQAIITDLKARIETLENK